MQANGTFGLGVLTADFDNDGWPDIYVANDSTASALYQNKKNGKFVDIAMEAGCALSPDGKPQAGMGVSAADYDMDGNLDIVKTNFAGDTPSLYHNLGDGSFEDATFAAGLGAHTQYLGWGCGFFDMDNDGWPDILICNGHVYPEVEQLKTDAIRNANCSIATCGTAALRMCPCRPAPESQCRWRQGMRLETSTTTATRSRGKYGE